jgi:homoserine kinase type II
VAEDHLVTVFRHYDLGRPIAARRVERGFVNDNWIADTTSGRYFLKRRHPDLRQPAVIRAQHTLMARLRAVGFPAPVVFPTTAGQTFLAVGGELYEVHGYIDGGPYDRDRPAHLAEAATTLACYHAHVEGLRLRPLCRSDDLYSPQTLQANLAALTRAWGVDRDTGLTAAVQQLEAHRIDLAARFARHESLPWLTIHGDYYAGNLLFDGDRIVGVVDYDKARWQPRVVELAEAAIYFASPHPGDLRHLVYPGVLSLAAFARFFQCYGRAVCLQEDEARALPDYVRCIWLSVSLQRLLERDPGPASARDALDEVLALGDWAQENEGEMTQAALAASCQQAS